ncbi:MAG: tRNA-dihydrouridine synthase, partial [Phaeodactylibacter sp.]|nr:tRNA-dihydrouridine synthase [Phaeodactylibacter sp.]
PWIFREIKHYFETGELLPPPTIAERVAAARQHLQHSLDWKGETLGVLEMRRHYTNYFRGYPGVKAFRGQLVTEHDPKALFQVLDALEAHYTVIEAQEDLAISQ